MVEKTTVVQVLGDRIASVEVVAGRAAGTKMMLSAGTFVIGREGDADLQLGDEPGVSRVHAKIVAERDRYRLFDNESRNGTILNGTPIRSEVLNDGDVIDIAQCRIVFRQLGGPPRPTASPPPPPALSDAPTPVFAAPATSRFAPPPPASAPQAGFAAAPLAAPAPAAVTTSSSGRRVVAITFGVTVVVLGVGAAVAWFAVNQAPRHAALPTSTTPPATTQNAPTTPATTPPPSTTTPPPPTTTTTPEAAFVAVTSENHAEVLRARERGRVQALPVAVGAHVKPGDVLVVLAGEAGNAADLATRRESIAALEGIADGNEAASRQLATEKAELKALLAKAPQKKLLAPADGTLAALDVKIGESVRQAQVFGRIDGDAVVVRARVGADVAAPLSTGAVCELRTSAGSTAKGTLKEKVDRGAGQFELVVDAGDTKDVTGLRCPSAP